MTMQIYDYDHDEDDLGEDNHDEDNHDDDGDHETVIRLPVHQEMHELEASFDGGEIVTV